MPRRAPDVSGAGHRSRSATRTAGRRPPRSRCRPGAAGSRSEPGFMRIRTTLLSAARATPAIPTRLAPGAAGTIGPPRTPTSATLSASEADLRRNWVPRPGRVTARRASTTPRSARGRAGRRCPSMRSTATGSRSRARVRSRHRQTRRAVPRCRPSGAWAGVYGRVPFSPPGDMRRPGPLGGRTCRRRTDDVGAARRARREASHVTPPGERCIAARPLGGRTSAPRKR